jgi:hypothetical protein
VEDPIMRLAKLRVINLSREIEVDIKARLTNGRSSSALLEILQTLRARAAESMVGLAIASTEQEIRTLQWEVKRYDEFFGELRNILLKGIEHEREISADERQELTDLLLQTPEGEYFAKEMGLIDTSMEDAA